EEAWSGRSDRRVRSELRFARFQRRWRHRNAAASGDSTMARAHPEACRSVAARVRDVAPRYGDRSRVPTGLSRAHRSGQIAAWSQNNARCEPRDAAVETRAEPGDLQRPVRADV